MEASYLMMKKRNPFNKTLSALALALGASMASGIDFVVDTASDDSYDGGTLAEETADNGGLSLREAIGLANDNADEGDTVSFDSLTFSLDQTISLGSSLVIIDDLVINGALLAGVSQITVNAADGSPTRLIEINTASATGEGQISLDNLTLTGGQTEEDGGALLISAGSEVVIGSGAEITNNVARDGGAIHNSGALTIRAASFSNNTARGESGSGGAIFNAAGGGLVVEGATFTANIANRAGGAIEDQAGEDETTLLTNVTFSQNDVGVASGTAAPGNGGAVHITGPSNMEISGGSASGNIAASEGGAFWNGTGLMTINGTMIQRNIASGNDADNGGGGVFNNGGDLQLTSVTLGSNVANGASGSGGGVFSTDGEVTITQSTLSGNIANRAGGGIEIVNGTLNIDASVLGGTDLATGNVAGPDGSARPGNGGALHISGRCVTTISRTEVAFNTAASEGGGLWNQNSSTMTLSAGNEVTDNIALGDGADNGGGGIFNNGGDLFLEGTDESRILIARNSATGTSGSGGGLFVLSGIATVSNTDFTENVAYRAGGGIEDVTGDGLGLILNNVRFSANNAGGDAMTAAPGNGGALHVTGSGDTSIIGGSIFGNIALSEGGGLWNGSGTMTILGVNIDENTASGASATEGGGGLFNNGGTMLVTDTDLSNNIADGASGSGGGVFNEAGGTLTITNGSFTTNRANRAGGGIEDNSGADTTVTLTDIEFSGNNAGIAPAVAAPGNGGAIHITGPGEMLITGCSATDNVAAREGGAYWNGSGTMTVAGGELQRNVASGPDADDGGGALFNNGGSLFVSDASLEGNIADGAAGSGGAIFSLTNGRCVIENSRFSENIANRAGGAIEAVSDTTTTIIGSTFTSNTAGPVGSAAPGNGGAFHLTGAGEITVANSDFDGNIAANEGGGLWNSGVGMMTITNSLIRGGTSLDGGGLFQQAGDGGVMLVRNSTVSGNTGTTAGGLQIEGARVSLLNVTLADNTSGAGGVVAANGAGGIVVLDGALSLTNTIIADNGPTDLNGAVADSITSLLENGTGATGIMNGADGNIVGVDPGLAPLADNGGPTQTHLILCESPVYNTGTNSALMDLATDQRGDSFDRIYAGVVDMGALELRQTSFAAWADLNFTDATPADQRQADDNPDGDSRSNAIEFLTGSNPEDGSDTEALLTSRNDEGEVTFSYDFVPDRKLGSDGVETSLDLQNWTTMDGLERQETSVGGPTNRVTITLPTGETKIFARIFLETE